MYVVPIKNEETARFIARFFNEGVVPEVNPDAYYVVNDSDETPNEIVDCERYLRLMRGNYSPAGIFLEKV